MAHREVNRAEQNILAEMRTYFAIGATRTLSVRKAALAKLRETILQYEAEILHALTSDLGRPAFETYAFEIAPVLQEIETLEKNLDSWTKPKKVKTPLLLFSAKTEVRVEPYGLVLVIAPWNYPFHLLMMPVAGAVACGNVVAVKPSRRAPKTMRIVQTILSDVFPDVWVSVFPQISLEETYDYIFFTGGIETGRKIAVAAAQHLTPVTLELGGKNPCIVDETANLNAANALLERREAEQALRYLEKAGNSPQTDNARGVALILLERYDEAKPCLERAAQAGIREAETNLEYIK